MCLPSTYCSTHYPSSIPQFAQKAFFDIIHSLRILPLRTKMSSDTVCYGWECLQVVWHVFNNCIGDNVDGLYSVFWARYGGLPIDDKWAIELYMLGTGLVDVPKELVQASCEHAAQVHGAHNRDIEVGEGVHVQFRRCEMLLKYFFTSPHTDESCSVKIEDFNRAEQDPDHLYDNQHHEPVSNDSSEGGNALAQDMSALSVNQSSNQQGGNQQQGQA
ncbi:hypothetical protein F4778DRAFT_713508 [Xylariomycetidae sp. FL2044]|nr:hypothetical protein F4778DRAFT_713508 [Xylariomycetidae sp. FL2044]